MLWPFLLFIFFNNGVFHAANQKCKSEHWENTALLSNINLSLEQGKIYGILGPNGAGKTTLFKSMLLGLTAFFRRNLSDDSPFQQMFGSLIEYPAFTSAHRRGKFEGSTASI